MPVCRYKDKYIILAVIPDGVRVFDVFTLSHILDTLYCYPNTNIHHRFAGLIYKLYVGDTNNDHADIYYSY